MSVQTAVSTRERILLAAQDVVLTDGVARLTLEKAAVRAGLSKGGVLYHFKTRNDLVAAMVERLAERFDAGVRAHHAAAHPLDPVTGYPTPPPPGSFARAYVEECLAEPVTPQEQHDERIGAAVIAAIASEPKLLQPLRAAFEGWQSQIEGEAVDRDAAVRATVARFAADGLWLCELFGIDALTPTMREDLKHELLRMVN